MKQAKIACITPIDHLQGVFDLISSFGDLTYIPNPDAKTLRNTLIRDRITHIFTNPNQQGFFLGKAILFGTQIEVVNTCSTGTNHIDIEFCDKAGIKILSLKNDTDLIDQLPSTAELAFGLMVTLFRNIHHSFISVQNGSWSYMPFIGKQIKGSSIGIIGYGRLGKMMCGFCKAFGMDIYIYDPYKNYNDLDKLLQLSDVISLHVHVTNETRNMVDSKFISKMKQGSYLINTSRGELVDERAIIDAVSKNHLNGYATDVVKDEFSDVNKSELIKFSKLNKNIIITPHIGGMTIEGQTMAYKWAISKFKNN